VFIYDPDTIEKIPEIRALYYSEIKGKEGKGHPDFEYSRRKLIELEMAEKRLNELIKQALDRMNHYYDQIDEVEIPEKPIDLEAERKKTVEILVNEEEREEYKGKIIIENEQRAKEAEERAENLRWIQRLKIEPSETITLSNGFIVPSEVASNATYREYLDAARTMKSVRVIVDEYYSKYPKRKGLQKPEKEKRWW
jgi:hypothetical protein